MRTLLPPTSSGEIDVHEFYARDWLERGGLRVNFVTSVDGAATAGELSEGLQTPGDNRVFAALRDLADVILVGAGTARKEGYRAVGPSTERRALRRRFGLADELPIAVVSRSLRLDPASPLFTGAAPGARTIVLTGAQASAPPALAELADIVVCGDDAVDPGAARRALEQRGLTRVLCEGGPTLFDDLARAGSVDELCVSISPLLAGPGERRIVHGQPWTGSPRRLQLAGLLEDDGALFCRYRLGG